MAKKKTCEFQLTLKRKTGRTKTMTIQIETDGARAVAIRGLDGNGASVYDVSFSVKKRSAKGGDECYKCVAPASPCPPNELTEVACE